MALARSLGFVLTALPGGATGLPVGPRLVLAVLVAGALLPAEPLALASLAPALAGELLLGGLLGFAFGLPLRALLAGASSAVTEELPGAEGWPRAAVLMAAGAWVAGGGLELTLAGLVRSAATIPLGSWSPHVAPDLVGRLGAEAFRMAAAGLLPAAGFMLGLRVFVSLVTAPAGRLRGRSPLAPPVLALATVVFLGLFLEALAGFSGGALDRGLALALGGG